VLLTPVTIKKTVHKLLALAESENLISLQKRLDPRATAEGV